MTDIAYFTIKKRIDNFGFYLLSEQSFKELNAIPMLWERFEKFLHREYFIYTKLQNGNYKIHLNPLA